MKRYICDAWRQTLCPSFSCWITFTDLEYLKVCVRIVKFLENGHLVNTKNNNKNVTHMHTVVKIVRSQLKST